VLTGHISTPPVMPNEAVQATGYSVFSRDTNSVQYQLRLAVAYLVDRAFSAPAGRDIPDSFVAASGSFNLALRNADAAIASDAALRTPFECRQCGEDIDIENTEGSVHLDTDGHVQRLAPNMCEDCLNADYTYSRVMNRWLNNGSVINVRDVGPCTEEYAQENNYYWDDDEDEWLSTPPPRNRLLSYSANPFDHFQWDSRNKPNALVFGVELEMQAKPHNSAGQQALIDTLGGSVGEQFILKSDGSIGYGVELVTMPFTLTQHLDGSGVPWKDILNKVKDIAQAGKGTDTCGIHIHINKKALSALTIGKMLVFLNDRGLAPLITTIAQRPSSSYCGRSSKKLTDGTRSSENRYDIMNVSVRHPTCEVRMFKGNITLERVYKNIEFCHALVQYCRQSSMRTLTDWGAFSQWLTAHRGQYPNLVRFLIDSKTVGFRQLARDSRDGQVTIEDR